MDLRWNALFKERSCGFLSPGLRQLELNQEVVTTSQSHFPALEKDSRVFLLLSICWLHLYFFQVQSVALLAELGGGGG